MAGLALGGIKISLVKDFERIVEIRAQRHEHLRQRNNVTSCRSPTRELDTSQIKNDLKKKRYQEFLRRRSVSPEPCCSKHCTRKNYSPKICYSPEQHTSSSKMLHAKIQNTPIDKGRSAMSVPPRSSMTDGPSSHRRTSLRSERLEKGQASSLVSTSTHNILNVQRETFIHTEKIHHNSSIQRENRLQKRTLQDTGVQTDCGFVNVKESDVRQLARYLQEAMWREEAVKKKFAALQENISSLMNASTLIWTSRCSEDLLRNKIKALEEQMHVCLQKFPTDDMKKLVLQMEKQKLVYEEEALIALQKATQDKTEANSKAATLQEALITAKAEAVKWESLYEELNMNFSHLRERQLLSEEQLQQLHTQVELYMSRETELKEEVALLRQEKQELQYNICLLEEDNQTLRDEAQHLRDDSSEGQDFVMSRFQSPEKTEPQVSVRTESQVEEQLRHTQEKLQMKERECSELQTDLHTMEQECKSSQARLLQCREELRQLSHHRSSQMACGSRWRSWLFFLLLLIIVQVAVLWLSYPPFKEQVEYLYSDIETRIKNYLMEMDSPQHSGCFRPI